MTEAQVGVKLVLDDHASVALERVKKGFEGLSKKSEEVRGELSSMFKQAVAVSVGFQMNSAIDSMKSFGEEVMNAATGSAKQIKNLAGVLSLTDKTGMSFEAATEQASGFKEELESMAIKAGVSADSVIDAFSTIAERSGKSREEVMKLTGEMTQASKALPGGIGQMAGAFQQLESGIVRPRNALVQMIKQTGVATGSAKDISKKLSQMVQAGNVEGATKLAEAAISRMAKKMENAPPTFEGLVQSLKDIRENLYEAFGVPMLQKILPHLASFKKYILENKEKIEEFAKSMGEKVGHWVDVAAEKIQEGFKFLQDHGDEIFKAMSDGAEALMAAVRFIIAHKEEIAILYGGSKLPGIMTGIGAGIDLVKGAGGMVSAAGGGMGGVVGAAATAAGPVLAFAAAITAVGLAAYKGNQLYDQIKKDGEAGNVARIEMAQRMAKEMRLLTKDEQAFLDKTRKAGVEEAGGGEAGKSFGMAFDAMLAERTARMETMRSLEASDKAGNFGAFADAYNAAIQTGDKAMLGFLKGELEKNSSLQGAAIMENVKALNGGLEKMITTLGLSEGTSEFVRARAKWGEEKPAPEPKLNATFTGPITIKQDFRDQDPDRVAIVFKRDLERAASSRVGSVLGGRSGL